MEYQFVSVPSWVSWSHMWLPGSYIEMGPVVALSEDRKILHHIGRNRLVELTISLN